MDSRSEILDNLNQKPLQGRTTRSIKSRVEFPSPINLPTLPSLLSPPGHPIIHRDLSWLQFNERVLEQARPTSHNLPLERVKFLAISSSNLDEFFMVRYASLTKDILKHRNDPQGLRHLTHVRDTILETVAKFGARQTELLDLLSAELGALNTFIIRDPEESDLAYELGQEIFEKEIASQLSPPETFTNKLPHLNNLEMAIVFPDGLWFRVSRDLPPVWHIRPKTGEGDYFFFLDRLLLTYLTKRFNFATQPGMIRLTRDADVTTDLIEEGAEPTPSNVRNCLSQMDQGRPVRLQYAGNLSTGFFDNTQRNATLLPSQLIPAESTLCLHGLWKVLDILGERQTKDKLFYPPIRSHMPEPLNNSETLYEKLKEQDFLLHHPYDSFDCFVQWVKTACDDPKVKDIAITIYRMGTLSPIVPYLKEAAKEKNVRISIELRARFDEANNLRLTEQLMKAGCKLGFGFGKLKLHAKIALITREERDGLRYYTHLSTGNYNAKTARLYTDLAILTSNQDIGRDAEQFFDAVWNGKIPQGLRKLVLAPTNLHRRLLALIQAETKAALEGKPARIVAKVNALVDDQVVYSLYRASQKGVKVDLIVRGACSLIPRVSNLSSNIRVISIVDRFLEHSRLYYFEASNQMYLSSADWMPRNFFRRLEIAFPILDERIFSHIRDVVLPTYLEDTVKARELTPQGTWKKRAPRRGKNPVRAQFVFTELAANNYAGTPLNQ